MKTLERKEKFMCIFCSSIVYHDKEIQINEMVDDFSQKKDVNK